MRLTFLWLLFILFNTNSIFAQNKRFKLLVNLGLNASQVNGDKLAGFDKFGWNAGLGVERDVSQKSSFSFEINYSEKGSKDVVNTQNPIQDTLFRFNYIDIPLIYTYHFYPKFSAHTGIYNSVLLKASYDDFVNVYDRSSVIKKTDHGLLIGLAYHMNTKLLFQFRLSQSIYDVNSTFERYYNLVSNLSIRYKF